MKFTTSDILILSINFLFLTSSISAACTEEDLTALVAFKDHFPDNTFPSSWNTSNDCCFWDGVGCDDNSGRVTSLFFTSDEDDPDHLPVNLKGTIPPSIGDLSALESISFSSFRHLVGPLPAEMANLKNLQFFTIYNSSISGPIPSFISQWTPLQELEINYCSKVRGSIPSSLGSLVNLTSIDFDRNKLSGTIPSSLFGSLNTDLQAQLVLSHNKLTGPIPETFVSVDWRNIDVSYNKLCGEIPTGGNFSSFNGAPFAHNKCLCGTPLPPCK